MSDKMGDLYRCAFSRSLKWKLVAATLAVLSARFAAAQTLYTWQDIGGDFNGDFYDPNHWNPNGVINSTTGIDSVQFTTDTTYTVTLATFTNMTSADFAAGDVTLDTTGGGFLFTNSGSIPEQPSLQIADDPSNSGETASLTITSSDGSGGGGQGVGVGRFSNSTGTLTIDGQGSALVFYSDFFAAVGYTDDSGDAPGNGTMNVINGATFKSPQTYIDGTVHVGNGSTWDNTSNDPFGGTSTIRIGVTGSGSMLVDGSDDEGTAGSTLLSVDTQIGQDFGSNGNLTVDGFETTFTSNTVEVGQDGTAYLSIQHGATATIGSINIATAYRDAYDTGSINELNIQYDSLVNVSGAVCVGVADIGTLNVGGTYNSGSTNGTLNSDSGIVGVDAPGYATVWQGDSYSLVDGGPSYPEQGTWNVTNTLTVGENPDTATGQNLASTLNVLAGGLVTSGYGVIGDTYDPNNGSSSGEVVISGVLGLGTTAASEWSITNDLTIGNAGQGSVSLDDGGLLQVGGNIYLGRQSSGYGLLIVANSTGNVIPTTVAAANLYVGGDLNDDQNSFVGNAQVLVQGGQMLISHTATVFSNSSIYIGGNSFVAIGVDSARDVPDEQFSGILSVGDSAPGTLTINRNAQVYVSNSIHIGSNGNVMVWGTLTGGDCVNNGSLTQLDGTVTLGHITNSGFLGAGSVYVSGQLSAASIQQYALYLSGGSVQIDYNSIAPVNSLQSLSIVIGELDLADGELVMPTNGPTSLATLTNYIATGYDLGNWDGYGIISSTALANPEHSTTLGIGEVFGGAPASISPGVRVITSSNILIMYTWYGDANLDGVVNAADLALVSPTGTTWSQGDFNYDGVVNADDYALFMLGAAYGSVNISTTLPEPSILLLPLGYLLVNFSMRKRMRFD